MLTRRLFAILLALKTPALAQNVVGSSGVGGRVLPLPQQQTPPPPPPSSATVAFALNPANNYMDASFPGLSFEKESMCVPLLWDARNTKLVALLKLISPSITMRFGANEFCKYNANGTGTKYTIGANSEIAPVNIQQLAGFVQALGAKLIYDCPLWGDNYDPPNEAAEIAYVDSLLRPHILFYQFGNEPDLFGAWNNVYWDMWLALQSAAAAAVPGAKFGGASCALPSSGDNNTTNAQWTGPFADMMAGMDLLSCVTHHYYPWLDGDGGKYSNTQTLATWSPDSFLDANVASPLQTIAQRNGIPWRMEETNSVNDGGQPRYSDAFGAAVWVVDYCFQLAKWGCAGVNFHVGDNSPPYSPFDIDYTTGALTWIKPTFYGMLFVGQMLPGRLMDVSGAPATLQAYGVANDDGSYSVALQNKDSNPVTLTIQLPAGVAMASSMVLTDPGGLSAYTYTGGAPSGGTSFGGAAVQLVLLSQDTESQGRG
jgi:hypothetical protein